MRGVAAGTATLEDDFVRALTKLSTLPLTRDGPIGLAVSGGSDSMALLHLAAKTRSVHKRDVVVFTVDHGLRAGSAAEAADVGDACRALGLPHHTLHWSAPQPQQAAARAARYTLMLDALVRFEGHLLVTAHTADDQAETYDIRSGAKSGPYGLACMQALALPPDLCRHPTTVIGRPLLESRRQALRDWLTASDLSWVDDPSNQDPRFERVRVRGKFASDPDLFMACRNAAASHGPARRAADRQLADWFASDVSAVMGGFTFSALPAPEDIGARALGWTIQLLTAKSRAPDTAALRALSHRLAEPDDFRGATLGGTRLVRERSGFHLEPEHGRDVCVTAAILNARRVRLSEVLRASAVTVL